MNTSKKNDLGLKIQLFGVFLFIFTLILGIILYIQDPNVFCAGVDGAVDDEDRLNCYSTIKEYREQAEYLRDKYYIDENIKLNISFG